MQKKITSFVLSLFLLTPLFLAAQNNFILQLKVLKKDNDQPLIKILSNEKDYILPKAEIKIYNKNKLFKRGFTDVKGNFGTALLPGVYKCKITHAEYYPTILYIDAKNVSSRDTVHLGLIHFVLYHKSLSDLHFQDELGTFYYNPEKKKFDLTANPKRIKKLGFFNRLSGSDLLIKFYRRELTRISKEKPPEEEPSLFKEVNPESLKKIAIPEREKAINHLKKELEEDRIKAKTRKDSIIIQLREAKIREAEQQIDLDKKVIELQKLTILEQKRLIIASLIIFFLLLVLLYVLWYLYRVKRRNHQLLQEKNEKIEESIRYAQTIQKSLLPTEEEIKLHLPESFILYKPRNVVSGDFYWFASQNDKLILAAVDCTGHGVPGALMSVATASILNQIVNEEKISDPALILKSLHNQLVKLINKRNIYKNHDGADISVIVINRTTKTAEFCGAMLPLYLLKHGKLESIKGTIMSVGGKALMGSKVRTVGYLKHSIDLNLYEGVYLFTDGYPDQLGGQEKKPFNSIRFKRLFEEVAHLNFNEQKRQLEEELENWQGNEEQTDDILVIGFTV